MTPPNRSKSQFYTGKGKKRSVPGGERRVVDSRASGWVLQPKDRGGGESRNLSKEETSGLSNEKKKGTGARGGKRPYREKKKQSNGVKTFF